ncbi:MAG: NAD(P)/FAD-dependent oxidoreductase [Rhodospirillales bacterium]
MAAPRHYVIIGNGVAGNEAARQVRERDPNSRITIVSVGRLLFYNRYQLPRLFHEELDWRDFLVHPPAYYDDNRITVRRNSQVISVDAGRKTVMLAHKEELHYDELLVASGATSYLPEELADCAHLLDRFLSYRDARKMRAALPKGGRVVMLGGDVLGLDLARNLVDGGYGVTLVTGAQTFWPHRVETQDRPKFIDALRHMGMDVIEDARVARVEEGARGMSARRVLFADGREIFADVVMPFYGLSPAADFMVGSGVDMERGLLVKPDLRTTDASIWAAGDVCQIWSKEEKRYRFYYGWRNIRRMGEIAGRNMTGDDAAIETFPDEPLCIDDNGRIDTPYWEYQ